MVFNYSTTVLESVAMNGYNVSNVSVMVTEAPGYYYAGAEELQRFEVWYKQIHGYLASTVCIFGIIANILNIVVLTRKSMLSATNYILSGLAVSDGLTMVAYLPFALRFYVFYGTEPTPERNSLGAVRFMLFYACFSVVVHTVSIWLTVTLAVFRYLFIKHPRRGAILCSLSRAKLSVFLVYAVTLLVCIPNFVTITVQGTPGVPANATSIWIVSFKLESKLDNFIYNFNFWIQAIVVKLVPCIGLTILSILLIRTMQRAEKKSRVLRMQSMSPSSESDNNSHGGSARERKTNRTTRMLLIVVLLFLVTEFPQGILNLLSGILPNFVDEVYQPLGDLVDILALINNGINFILYCTMSKQFRDTFLHTFNVSKLLNKNKFSLVPTETSGTTMKTRV